MKKLKLFVMTIAAMLVAVTSVRAEDTINCTDKEATAQVGEVCYKELSNAINASTDGKTVTLLKDALVSSALNIDTGKKVTIDLNGHGIMNLSNVYTFDNAGELTIIGNDKSSIFCNSQSVSCIRNKGTFSIESVSLTSNFVGLKNESGKMTVKNSTIISSHKSVVKKEEKVVESGLGIQNYGELIVDNSTIKGNLGASAISNNKSATAKVTNSTLEAQSVKLEGTAALVGSTVLNTDEKAVEIKDSTLKGTIDGKVATSGEITTIMENLQHMTSGTKVVLAEDTVIKTGTLAINSEVPEGITLVVPRNVKLTVEGQGALTVKGTLEGKVDAAVENETKGVYYGLLEIALVSANANDGDKINILKDIEEKDYITPAAKDALAIVNSKDVTINLNGHKVTTDLLNAEEGDLVLVDEAGRAEFIGNINNAGALTIKSGYYNNVPTTEEGAKTNLIGGTYPANQLGNYEAPEGQEVVKNADGTLTLRYKDADFSELDEALAKASEIELTKYTTESINVLAKAVEAAENVDRTLTVLDQEKVDALTKALNDALAGLKEVENSSAENPNTLDSVSAYIAVATVALSGLVTLGYSIKKKFEN